ncbi:MAG: Coenzyme F420 hydrogenase/dehydrogenase, beta subunit C-terminal domain, partial [Promethearchaeota archaeon]
LDQALFGTKRENQAIGVYKKVVNAKLLDSSLKDIPTALFIAALDGGDIDCVVLPDAKFEKRLEPIACSTKDDILSNAGERRGLGPMVWGTGQAIRNGYSNIAVLCRPCHAQALAKIRASSDFIVQQDKIKLVIAQFCLAQGKGCTTCIDYTGEYADISIDPKTGDMIIRTDIGEAIVNKAVDSGKIEISDIEISAIEDKATKKKKKNLLKILAKNDNIFEADYIKVDIDNLKFLIE